MGSQHKRPLKDNCSGSSFSFPLLSREGKDEVRTMLATSLHWPITYIESKKTANDQSRKRKAQTYGTGVPITFPAAISASILSMTRSPVAA